MSSKTDTRSKLKSDGFRRKSEFFLNKKHLSNIWRGAVWSFPTNLQHNEVKMLFQRNVRSVSLWGQRRWCHCPSDPKPDGEDHAGALPGDGSVSTLATFTSQVHVYGSVPRSGYTSGPSKTKGLLCSDGGWNPPSAITVHLPETSVRSRTSALL